MATIPVNPERRDPGYFRKKADIGLPNVDNLSSTDLINVVADDVKIIGNQKVKSGKISVTEGYLGIIKTSEYCSHTIFTTGLFRNNKEEAQFNVDLSFSTKDSFNLGSLGLTIQAPSNDIYLKDLSLVFTQVGSEVYITLYSSKFPSESSLSYFDSIGTNLLEWTEGTILIDPTIDYYSIIKGGKELGRFNLSESYTTIQPKYCESLPVYNKETGEKVVMESRNYSNLELNNLDYPTINEVPFIAKKGMIINNKDSSRNITIPAKHQGPSKNEAGGHDWEVLNNVKVIDYSVTPGRTNLVSGRKTPDIFTQTNSYSIPNDDNSSYGLCKPSNFSKIIESFENSEEAINFANQWLSSSIGPGETDVVTVGMFRVFMNFLLNQIIKNISAEETLDISYTDWNINLVYSTSDISVSGEERPITVTATRKKIIRHYVNDTEVESKREEITENAENTKISVISVDGFTVTPPSSDDSHEWSITFPKNKKSTPVTRTIYVYADKGQETQSSSFISLSQKPLNVIGSSYSLGCFSTDTEIIAASGSYNINYSISVVKSWTDGSTTREAYIGSDVVFNSSNDSYLEFVKDGVMKITYPSNTTSQKKTYTASLQYKGVEESIEIIQDEYIGADESIGLNYIFYPDENNIYMESNSNLSHVVNVVSYLGERFSLSGVTKIRDVSFKIKSYSPWLRVLSNSTIVEIDCLPNESDLSRVGEIILVQPDSGKEVTIAVSQESANMSLVSDVWDVYSNSLNSTSEVSSGDIRIYSVVYRNTKTYGDGSKSIIFYNGEDINVYAEIITGSASTPGVSYNGDGTWNISIGSMTSDQVIYSIGSEYKGVSSTKLNLTQGKRLVRTDYEFSISKLDSNSIGTLSGNKITEIPSDGGTISVILTSIARDYYSDGTSYQRADTIPFTSTSGRFITSQDRQDNKAIFKVSENTTQSSRSESVTITQSYSGNSITLYFTQDTNLVVSYIMIDGTRYNNGEECYKSYSNTQTSSGIKVYPVHLINDVEQPIDYSGFKISESISWLSVSSYSDKVLSLSFQENSSGTKRSGTIYLSYTTGLQVGLNITQEAGEAYLTINGTTGVSDYNLPVTKESQTISVNVQSNYSFTISSTESSWISNISGLTSYSAGDSTIAFKVTDNNTLSSRSYSFTVKSSGGITRVVTITQSPREYYLDITNFEGQDLYVTTSEWKNKIVIPIKNNVQFMVDYYSDWLNTAILDSDSVSSPYGVDANSFCNHLRSSSTSVEEIAYLYISQKDVTSNPSVGVVSLSYFDTTTNTIMAARKIYVTNLSNSRLTSIYGQSTDKYQVLPYEPRDMFVSGDSTPITLYAYTKSSKFGIKVLSELTDSELLLSFVPSNFVSETPSSTGLTKMTITLPENTTGKYRDLSYTLVPYDSISSSIDESLVPVYRIHQGPKISLKCFYLKGGVEVSSVNIGASGYSGLVINSRIIGCSGHFEIKNGSLPGWINPLSTYSDSSGEMYFNISKNTTVNARSVTLQFWCDSNLDTLSSVTINQSGASSQSSETLLIYDSSLITATSESSYMYIYNVKNISIYNEINTDGTSEMSGITTNLTKSETNIYKLEYILGAKNKYYHKDLYRIIKVTGNDDSEKFIFIKNPRTSDITINVENLKVNENSSGSNSSFTLSSNIGLTGFLQSTNPNIYKTTIDYTTSESENIKSTYSMYFYSPIKQFYKPQVMDKVLLKNMDILQGYTREVLINQVSTPSYGIEVKTKSGDTIFSISNTLSQTETYNLYLPSKKYSSGTILNTEVLYAKSYDGITISKSDSGNGFVFTNFQPTIVKKVGSLGTLSLSFQSNSDNTGTSDIFLGTVTLTIPNGVKKTIYVYQKSSYTSLIGNTGVMSVVTEPNDISVSNFSDTSLIYTGTNTRWDITFGTEYPNWMLVLSSGTSSALKFGSKSYSASFNSSGGNSGTSSTSLGTTYNGCRFSTSLEIDPSGCGYSSSNNTLEMKNLCTLGLVSSNGTDGIDKFENARSTINLYTRPDIPEFRIYNTSNEFVKGTDSKETSTSTITATSRTISRSTSKTYSIKFRVKSNYINNAKSYVDKEITLNGSTVKIETEYDIFQNLLGNCYVKYLPTGSTTYETKEISSVSYSTGESDGESYAEFSVTITTLGTITSPSIVFKMNDFIVDSKYYTSSLSGGYKELIVPVTILTIS